MNFEKSLDGIVVDLLSDQKYIFYGLFLAELNKSFSSTFPSACVAKHYDSPVISLIIGEKFWEKTCFNQSRKKSIVLHEVEHVIREHLSEYIDGMFPQKYIANIAMDRHNVPL